MPILTQLGRVHEPEARHTNLVGSDAKLIGTGSAEPTLDVIMRCIREDLDSDSGSNPHNARSVVVPVNGRKHPTKFDAVMSAVKSLPAAILKRR